MGDRSGSRESKGTSLKKSKNNPGSSAARVKTIIKTVSSISLHPPYPQEGCFFDCGTAILSRQFERDRDRVFQRCESENLSGVICWFADIEKQQELIDVCKNYNLCYFFSGIHPDNIDRTNKKHHTIWLEKIEEIAKKAECLGITTGLNLSRDVGTHFPQEAMLQSCCILADKLILPIILHCTNLKSLLRAIEILKENEWVDNNQLNNNDQLVHRKIFIYDILSYIHEDTNLLSNIVSYGFYFIISAKGITDTNIIKKNKSFQLIKEIIPLNKIFPCTNSPWNTPQNHSDVYLRTLRNEPCNIRYVNEAICEAIGGELEAVSAILYANVICNLFGFGEKERSSVATTETSYDVSDQALLCPPPAATADETAELTDQLLIGEELEQSLEEPEAGDAEAEIGAGAIEADEDSPQSTVTLYRCAKCRSSLFSEDGILGHDTSDTVTTVFSETRLDPGLCKSTLFVPFDAENSMLIDPSILTAAGAVSTTQERPQDGQGPSPLVDADSVGWTMRLGDHSNILCGSCDYKVGKLFYSSEDCFCACGRKVSGTVAKILAHKVDASMESLSLSLLSRCEHRDMMQQHEEEGSKGQHAKTTGKKTPKNVHHRGKGNYSSFRNKSFKPNASRALSSKQTVDEQG